MEKGYKAVQPSAFIPYQSHSATAEAPGCVSSLLVSLLSLPRPMKCYVRLGDDHVKGRAERQLSPAAWKRDGDSFHVTDRSRGCLSLPHYRLGCCPWCWGAPLPATWICSAWTLCLLSIHSPYTGAITCEELIHQQFASLAWSQTDMHSIHRRHL